MGAYDDILHLPHHRSAKHPAMSMQDRAAQFSSFRALTGYDDAICETARLTDRRTERSEEEQQQLNEILHRLEAELSKNPTVTILYFQPDVRKEGGAYRMYTGQLHAIDRIGRRLVFRDKWAVQLEDVYDISEAE